MKRSCSLVLALIVALQLFTGCAAFAEDFADPTSSDPSFTAATTGSIGSVSAPFPNGGAVSSDDSAVSSNGGAVSPDDSAVSSDDSAVSSDDSAVSSDDSAVTPAGSTSASILDAEDLSAYENGEVFVMRTDGTCQVLTYDSDDALAAGIRQLAEDETISLIQPNYSYEDRSMYTTDQLFAQQWALYNDGSFRMEQQKNTYPVFDEPFGQPTPPGQWTGDPWRNGKWRRHSIADFTSQSSRSSRPVTAASTTQTTAVADIDINAEGAWQLYNGGVRDVVIALVDTGIDYGHEDLAGNIWINEDEIPGNDIDDDGNGYVDDVYGWNFYAGNHQVYTSSSEDSHGTHGAGTIVANTNNDIGVAGIIQSDHVKVMAVKALGGADGSGTTASIIEAIRYAEANGASICNLSLGTTWNDQALYQTMANSKMLFVVAAGNDSANTDRSPSYPASYNLDNIITVANLNCDGTLHESSNYGVSTVDLAAPGSYILSTTSENSYSYMTGTSMSAPMVSAAAAMVYSQYSDITLGDVRQILLSSAKPLNTLTGLTATGGMLDLGAALSFDRTSLPDSLADTQVPSWLSDGNNGSVASGSPDGNSSGNGPGNLPDGHSGTSGSAPQISTRLLTLPGGSYLTVEVTDADGDIVETAYATGNLSAAEFSTGKAGTPFSLESDGTAIFTISGGGIYTFYARDSAGNETTQTVWLMSGYQQTLL